MSLTEQSYFWTTSTDHDGASEYTEADLAEAIRIIAACMNSVGVARGYLNGLAATVPGANTVTIATGAAIVDGKPYSNLGSGNLTIPSASGGGNTRIDRIVLRADWANHEVRLTVVSGVDAAIPTAPAVTQTPGTTYDVLLWRALVNTSGAVTVTDERTWAQPGTDAIATAALQAASVTTAKIADVNVTTGKLADGAVTTAKLAADSVDDTIAGNRVPQFYRRQGGSATIWAAAGSTNYTPTSVRMQAGQVTVVVAANNPNGTTTVTFPVAFSNHPLVFVTLYDAVNGGGPTVDAVRIRAYSNSNSQVDITVDMEIDVSHITTYTVNWLAIGPE